MTNVLKEAAHLKVAAIVKIDFSLGEIDLGFGFDYIEDLRGGGGAVAESFPSLGHVVGGDGEYDVARIRADEMKIAVAADETSWKSVAHIRILCRSGSIHRSRGKINKDLQRGDRNFDVYQIGTDAAEGKIHGLELVFATGDEAAQAKSTY
jgi:hypothetical protein